MRLNQKIALILALLFIILGSLNIMDKKILNISQVGIDLIKEFEGFRSPAYLCPGLKWTVGYGSTIVRGQKVRPGVEITEEEAEAELKSYLSEAVCPVINDIVKVPLTQNEFDALCSFTYNLGEGALRGSTLLKKINVNSKELAANEFLKWDNIVTYKHGEKIVKSLPGLTRRRQAEKDLFLKKQEVKSRSIVELLLGILGFRQDSSESHDESR